MHRCSMCVASEEENIRVFEIRCLGFFFKKKNPVLGWQKDKTVKVSALPIAGQENFEKKW